MSILEKLSDVLKEVFWIKTSKKRKSSVRRPKAALKKKLKRVVKKAPKKPLPKASKITSLKPIKEPKPAKPVKAPKSPKTAANKKPLLDPNLVPMGEITHYFDRIKVSVVKINQGTVLIGDKLTIVGQKSKFVQKVWSMQIESEDVKVARKGQLIGLKVDKPVVVGDIVYK
jgi:hypothetical protein